MREGARVSSRPPSRGPRAPPRQVAWEGLTATLALLAGLGAGSARRRARRDTALALHIPFFHASREEGPSMFSGRTQASNCASVM
jgi:hypothetical protein